MRTLLRCLGAVPCFCAFWMALDLTATAAGTSRVEQVILVFKTHFDIGYTDMASNVVRRYRTTMIDDALRVVDQNRALPPEQQFAWTLPGWPLSKILEDWPGQTPERQQRVRQAFQEGRLVVHALPFTTHTELLEPEDLVRGLGFASRLSRAASLELPRDAKMTDVPCHSWILPTLLRHAGVDFLHLGCNAASSSPRVPRLFFWEGPDGSRLLTMYTAESYGTGLVPPRDWPYRTWLALIHTGDNHGPPTPAEVKQLLDEARAKLPGVKVRIGRLSDFADGILSDVAEGRVPRVPVQETSGTRGARPSEVPVVRGDMPDTWIHGPMSDPQGAKLAKNTRPAIAMAESLNTLLGAWGLPAPEIAGPVAQAYEQSLLYGEHTWGGAQYWVTKYGAATKWSYGQGWKADRAAGRFQRLEDSWAEHTAYIETARDVAQPLLRQQLSAVAAAVAERGPRLVVFNPLPWKRTGLAEVALPPGHEPAFEVQPVGGGAGSPAAYTGSNRLAWIAADVPPMGYLSGRAASRGSLPDRSPEVDRQRGVLESPFFRVTVDPAHGAIRSLFHKPSGRELIDASAAPGFGQHLYERFDADQVAAYVKSYVKISADWAVNELGKPSMPPAPQAPYRAASPTNVIVRLESGPLSASALIESEAGQNGLPYGVSIRLTVYSALDCVDLEVTIEGKPADPWPEAGWLCLPFKIAAPQFRLGRLGSVIDPSKDIVAGANRHLLGIHTGVALFDTKGGGVGLCPLDSPLVSLDEPGCWKYSPDFVPRRPVVYVNLFNNQWTTNFRLWNEGTWSSRVRLWVFDRYDAESSLVTPSLEARYPLQAAYADGSGGSLLITRPGLSLSRKGVLVTAFGPNPDGPGLLLRLWESAGQAGSCTVRLPAGLKAKALRPVDLRGRPVGGPLPVKDDTAEIALRPFAPLSFLLE